MFKTAMPIILSKAVTCLTKTGKKIYKDEIANYKKCMKIANLNSPRLAKIQFICLLP